MLALLHAVRITCAISNRRRPFKVGSRSIASIISLIDKIKGLVLVLFSERPIILLGLVSLP
jgi:hypothetical protein